MFSFNLLLAVCLGYVGLLFLIAWVAEQQARRGGGRWLRTPVVYTLSISIYCTAWTFYGAVGYGHAHRASSSSPSTSGRRWSSSAGGSLLRKLVRIGRDAADHLDRRPDLVALRQVEPAGACW